MAEPQRSLADVVTENAISKYELFKDRDLNTYAAEIGSCIAKPLKSGEFAETLRQDFWKQRRASIGESVLSNAMNTLSSCAKYEGTTYEVATRMVGSPQRIAVDLGRADEKILFVDGSGSSIVKQCGTMFIRNREMQSLPVPNEAGEIDRLREFLNCHDRDFYLIVAWILSCFRSDIPSPILVLTGEQGSAKSTNCRVLRKLIDPNSAPLRNVPSNERELAAACRHNALICLENVSTLTDSMSDALCKVCTGSAFSTREYFTTADEITYQTKRPILINGISDSFLRRSDLLDRSIIIDLPTIAPKRRQEESVFWRRFECYLPEIFSAIVAGLSCGIRKLPNVKLTKKPRMADFATWISACMPDYGITAREVQKLYWDNIHKADQIALSGDLFAQRFLALVRQHGDFTGTATELRQSLQSVWPVNELRYLPTPRGLSEKLSRLAPNLSRLGITVKRNRSAKERTLEVSMTQ